MVFSPQCGHALSYRARAGFSSPTLVRGSISGASLPVALAATAYRFGDSLIKKYFAIWVSWEHEETIDARDRSMLQLSQEFETPPVVTSERLYSL